MLADSFAANAASIRAIISPSSVRDVGVPGDEPDVLDPGGLDDLAELLELDRAAGQPVDVVDQHGVDQAVGQVGQHPLVLGSSLAGVGRQVVVDVLLGHDPAQVRPGRGSPRPGGRPRRRVPSGSLEMRA